MKTLILNSDDRVNHSESRLNFEDIALYINLTDVRTKRNCVGQILLVDKKQQWTGFQAKLTNAA
jgi:hypothetical protein